MEHLNYTINGNFPNRFKLRSEEQLQGCKVEFPSAPETGLFSGFFKKNF